MHLCEILAPTSVMPVVMVCCFWLLTQPWRQAFVVKTPCLPDNYFFIEKSQT